MIKRYSIEYDWTTLAEVEVDTEKAEPFIREMVEFWAGWEQNLVANQGSYLRAWLRQLGMFILNLDELPDDDEGWYNLHEPNAPNTKFDHGITVLHWEAYEYDMDGLTVEEITNNATPYEHE